MTVATLGPGPGAMTVILAPEEAAVNYRSDVQVICTPRASRMLFLAPL